MSEYFIDWKRNKGNIKSRIVLVLFRLNGIAKKNKILFVLMIPYLCFYRVIVEWFLGIELPWKTKVGPGLIIHHGQALVINDSTVIGENCTIRQSTTIGNKNLPDGNLSTCPIIGDNVDIGCNVCIIGPISIGNNVIIGAGSVVISSFPSNTIVAGNPAKVIRYHVKENIL